MKYILKNTRILLYLRVFMISHSYVPKFTYEWCMVLVNVLTLSALRSGGTHALDLSLAASHRA